MDLTLYDEEPLQLKGLFKERYADIIAEHGAQWLKYIDREDIQVMARAGNRAAGCGRIAGMARAATGQRCPHSGKLIPNDHECDGHCNHEQWCVQTDLRTWIDEE